MAEDPTGNKPGDSGGGDSGSGGGRIDWTAGGNLEEETGKPAPGGDFGAEPGTETGTGSESESGTESGFGTGAETGGGTGSHPGTGADSDTGADTGADSGTGAEPGTGGAPGTGPDLSTGAVTGAAATPTYRAMYGPPVSFIGSPWADVNEPATFASADVVILGAPFDGGTTNRPGARFGPRAIRSTDYLEHGGPRPHLALGVDVKQDLRIVDAGDVVMHPGEIEPALARLEDAVTKVTRSGAIPVVLGGDHSIALPDVTGVARHLGFGRVSVVHFDAHADTGETMHGSLLGHGTPMRRLIESGAARGDRFLQIGLRGYWPGPEVLAWMADQGMRSYEMAEVVRRGLDACLDEAFEIATRDCDGVFLSIDVDVVDPGMAPGTGTPEPGGLTSRQLLDAVRRCALELPVAGVDVVEVSPPYDGPGEVTAYLANRVVLEALSGVARRRRDAAASATP